MYGGKFFPERGPDLMQMLLNVPACASSDFVEDCGVKGVVVRL